jgi:hypothetical protein
MIFITVGVRLYGELSCYGNSTHHTGNCSSINVQLPLGSTLKNLIDCLLMCTHERGFTFINEKMSALPNVQPDLEYQLQGGDQILFFPLRMAPTKLQFEMKMTDKMIRTVRANENLDFYYLYEQGQG